jgi:hypothetical protein
MLAVGDWRAACTVHRRGPADSRPLDLEEEPSMSSVKKSRSKPVSARRKLSVKKETVKDLATRRSTRGGAMGNLVSTSRGAAAIPTSKTAG